MAQVHPPQIEETAAGRTVVVDSATHVEAYGAQHPCAGDVFANSSYSGALCARMVMSARPKAVIGLDCAIGQSVREAAALLPG